MICCADSACSSCKTQAAQTMAGVLLESFDHDELHAVFPSAVMEQTALGCFGLGHFGAVCPGSPQL
jgi:hypothetical protein